VHVTWPGTLVLAASPTTAAQQPVAYIWALIKGTQSGLSIPGTVQACGLALPDFTSTLLPETYGVTVNPNLWGNLAANSGTVTVSNTSATATYTTTTDTQLIGIGTTPTAWTTWPALATAQADEINSDMDNYVGVTLIPKTGTAAGGSPYANPPVDGFTINRTDSLWANFQSVLSLSGALTSCTAASGTANVTSMDSHIIGCHLVGKPTTADAAADYCDSTQTTFLDTNSPHLTPHAGTFSAVKLGSASAACSDVLTALP
jgi:hypothetical protein